MVQVDYFKAEVKYSGEFRNIEEAEWRTKAKAFIDRGGNAYDHSELLDDKKAKEMNGWMIITDKRPRNKVAEIYWAEIEQEEN